MTDLRIKENDWCIYGNQSSAIKINHRHSVNGSIGWGTINDTYVYTKTLVECYDYFKGLAYYKDEDKPIDDLYKAYIHGLGLCAAILRDGYDIHAIVVDAESFGEVAEIGPSLESYVNPDYEYLGYVFLSELYESHEPDKMTAAALLYVAFCRGPMHSRIPGVWLLTGLQGGTRIGTDDMFGKGDLTNEQEVNPAKVLYSKFKQVFPSLENLKTDDQNRYEQIRCIFTNKESGEPYIVYNRNHVAYNGTISALELMLPVIMWNSVAYVNDIESETISDFLRGKGVGIAVHLKGSVDEPVADESAPTPTSHRELVEDNKGINALLRAAGRANIKFKE